MNPNAREFVPAHILQKRQEEANRLNELTDQLDRVDIEDNSKGPSNGTSYDSVSRTSDPSVGDESSDKNNEKPFRGEDRIQNSTNDTKTKCDPNSGVDHDDDSSHKEKPQNSNDNDEDSYLLRAGENICEFNGEQFIIPGDEEEDPLVATGYDFGNDEDNEDQEVCSAFEEFLENLPNH